MTSASATAPATAHPAPGLDYAHGAEEDGRLHVHIVPPRVLLGVYAVLVVLTVVTVGVTKFDFGILNVWVALIIAVIKAGFVVMYFMHLRYDKPFYGLVFITALLFVAVFIGVAMLDSSEYKPNYTPPGTRVMITSQNGG